MQSLPAEEVAGWRGIFSSLNIGCPATPEHKCTFWPLFVFSRTPLFPHHPSFFSSLAHGSTPSNSSVSQTKSYFLIHSLAHIIILLDGVSGFCFFLQHCLFYAQGDITVGQRRPGSYSVAQRSGLFPLIHTYAALICALRVDLMELYETLQ